MLDYNKLRQDFKKVLSKIDNNQIKEWLKFDQDRILKEN